MENFFSTLKIELVYRNSWRTRAEAENAIFAYIDEWYTLDASSLMLAGPRPGPSLSGRIEHSR